MSVKEVQPINEPKPILSSVLGILTDFKDVQPANENSPIASIALAFANDTDSISLLFVKAESAISNTVKEESLFGTDTFL